MKLETERLRLREWREEDKALYAAMIGDPTVRRFSPSIGTYADAEASVERARERFAEDGFSFMAVERKADGCFMGMLGMTRLRESVRLIVPGEPEVEIGWLLDKPFWGQGYAPEAARAVLAQAFERFACPDVVAITYKGNCPSRRVMEKIGMRHNPASDFLHPDVPADSPVRPHVLYRIANPALTPV